MPVTVILCNSPNITSFLKAFIHQILLKASCNIRLTLSLTWVNHFTAQYWSTLIVTVKLLYIALPVKRHSGGCCFNAELCYFMLQLVEMLHPREHEFETKIYKRQHLNLVSKSHPNLILRVTLGSQSGICKHNLTF
jgi:hypothetical protein